MRKKIPIFFWNFFKQLDEMFVHFSENWSIWVTDCHREVQPVFLDTVKLSNVEVILYRICSETEKLFVGYEFQKYKPLQAWLARTEQVVIKRVNKSSSTT